MEAPASQNLLLPFPPFSEPAVGQLIAAHICDRVALAVGATRDGQEAALQRGCTRGTTKCHQDRLGKGPISYP